jgi:hypothetical protein
MSSELSSDTGVFCLPVNKPFGALRHISRVPCKARGISENHTAWNSYIDIPANAHHGDELSCSNKQCSSSGRKFRYCAMCALPVASRNFSKRHSHGMIGSTRGSGGSKRTNYDNDDDDFYVPPKKIRIVCIPVQTHAPDEDSSADRMKLTVEEQKFLNLMKSRPSDDSQDLSLWIQSVLDLTSYVSYHGPKQTSVSESLNNFECYERDQLHDAVLKDVDDEERSVDSGFVFEMGGEFLHGA